MVAIVVTAMLASLMAECQISGSICNKATEKTTKRLRVCVG
jgi:hypothetical protein